MCRFDAATCSAGACSSARSNRAFQPLAHADVRCQVAFQKYRLVSIDCPNSCFTVVFSLHLRWFDPSLTDEDKVKSKAWDAGWEPEWKPRIDFVNETEVSALTPAKASRHPRCVS